MENTVVLNCNFGFLYGMQAEKFVLYALANYGVTLTLDQSRQFRQRFFDEYTGLQAWHEVTLREGKRRRTSTTPMGRLRYMDEMAHNEYLNHPVQACLCPEVRVLTTQGYEAIGELYTQGCGDRQVWTGVCWADFEVRAMGAHPLAEIELQDGSILRCDTNHQLLVVEESGYVWRSYADLREGDRVATSLVRAVEFSGELLPEMEHGERSTLKPELPAGMDADLWWWLGYYMGNGWLADRGCLSYVMGEHRPDLLKKCVDFWVGWGANPKVTHQTRTMPSGKTGRAVKIDVWSVDIVRWLYKLGFVESTAHTKRIPKLVFTATLQQRQQFVMGLFGADGYNNNPCQGDPNLHMCNRLLLEDTKVILRSLGVESVLRGPYTYKGFTSYRLDIFNRMWRDMLGEGSGHWPKLVGMDVPAFLLRAVKLRYGYEKMRKFPSNSAYVLYRRMLAGGTVGVYTFDRLCAAMGWVFEEPLYGYRCLVAKRELGITGTTYTLSVDDPLHRFDAEGVITKNSGADGLKLSLREIFMRTKKYGGAVKMVHHVHDEIITELPDDEELAKKWSLEMKEGMEGAMSKVLRKVPVLAEPAVGYSWGDKS